jgi:hypothetical protein
MVLDLLEKFMDAQEVKNVPALWDSNDHYRVHKAYNSTAKALEHLFLSALRSTQSPIQ